MAKGCQKIETLPGKKKAIFFFQGRKGCFKKKKGTNFILVEVVNFCYQVLTSVEDISCSFSVGAQAAIH